MEQLLAILNEMNDTIDYESEKALIDGEIIDSLDLMELVMGFEDMFGVEIPTDDLAEIATVGDVIEFLKSMGIEAQAFWMKIGAGIDDNRRDIKRVTGTYF